MKELAKVNSKSKAVQALLAFFLTIYLADPVYIIGKKLTGDTPSVTLWISGYDYRSLLILANGSRVGVLEIEANTKRYARGDNNNYKAPEGTEGYKYVSIS